jgi:SRSO17 transposase
LPFGGHEVEAHFSIACGRAARSPPDLVHDLPPLRAAGQFEGCLSGHVQRRNAGRYVEGLLSDAQRRSVRVMQRRLADPGSYQGLQHFSSQASYAWGPFWKRLRALLPVRASQVLLDETSVRKRGRHSVDVARQYYNASGKVANSQVAVSSAVRAEDLTWPLAMSSACPPGTPSGRWVHAGDGPPPH